MSKLRYVFIATATVMCFTLTACKLTEKQAPAPITNAGTSQGNEGAEAGTPVGIAPQAVYYTVQPGDSLYRIAKQFGQSWQDIASWNNIGDPSSISVGTVLLVSPTAGTTTKPAGTATQPTGGSVIEPAAIAGVESRMQWDWPAKGPIVGKYDGANNKGVDIGGNAGDPVYASADGRVAYVGDGLRGYGNLVIIKHNDIFVTAYAHNQKILVAENQVVRRGEKIAEMGSTDASRVMLHFEVRQQGSDGGSGAVDPMKYLPAR